jgi:WD40 repeat protein
MCFWAGGSTLLVSAENTEGPFVVDMDAPKPQRRRIESVPHRGFLSAALLRRPGGRVRWVLGGGTDSLVVVEGDPREPWAMMACEVRIIPPGADTLNPERRILAVALSSDGRWVAAGGDWRDAYALDLSDRTATPRPFRPETAAGIDSLAFTSNARAPDTHQLLVGSNDSLNVFDVEAQKPHVRLPTDCSVRSFAFAGDGRLAFGLNDGFVGITRIEELPNCAHLRWPSAALGDKTSGVLGLAFTPRGDRIVAATGEGASFLGALFVRSSTPPGEALVQLADEPSSFRSLDVSEDGLLVVTGRDDGLVEVRAVPNGGN